MKIDKKIYFPNEDEKHDMNKNNSKVENSFGNAKNMRSCLK